MCIENNRLNLGFLLPQVKNISRQVVFKESSWELKPPDFSIHITPSQPFVEAPISAAVSKLTLPDKPSL